MMAAIATMQTAHTVEVERIQAEHRATVAMLINRLGDTLDQQAETAKRVQEAAATARQAAKVAEGAATTAAKSASQIREAPIP